MIILAIVVILMIVNSLTFIMYYKEHERELRQLELRVIKSARAGEVMNYFLPGMMDQPDVNYAFLVEKKNGRHESIIPELNGGMTMVYFRHTGWDALPAAIAIQQDIAQCGYKRVRIFSLSVGDHVTRELEWYLGSVELENIAINPCSSEPVLNALCQWLVMYVVPIVRLLDYALGWLSIAPVISPGHKKYSLWLITDQATQLGCWREKFWIDSTLGVILSSRDEFLDNGAIKQHFGEDVPYVMIDAKHADTRGHAEEYRKAVQNFLHNSRFK